MMIANTEEQWEQVYERLKVFVLPRIADRNDADDVLQEVFLKIHDNIQSLKETDNFWSWIYQITRNAIVDYYRSKAGRSKNDAGLIDIQKLHIEPDKENEATRELTSCLEPMMSTLPKDQREALVLVEFEKLTKQEAAEKIGISVSGMKSRVQRARKKLMKMLLDCCRVELDSRRRAMSSDLREGGRNYCEPLDEE